MISSPSLDMSPLSIFSFSADLSPSEPEPSQFTAKQRAFCHQTLESSCLRSTQHLKTLEDDLKELRSKADSFKERLQEKQTNLSALQKKIEAIQIEVLQIEDSTKQLNQDLTKAVQSKAQQPQLMREAIRPIASFAAPTTTISSLSESQEKINQIFENIKRLSQEKGKIEKKLEENLKNKHYKVLDIQKLQKEREALILECQGLEASPELVQTTQKLTALQQEAETLKKEIDALKVGMTYFSSASSSAPSSRRTREPKKRGRSPSSVQEPSLLIASAKRRGPKKTKSVLTKS